MCRERGGEWAKGGLRRGREEGNTQPMGVSGYQLPVTSRYIDLNFSFSVVRPLSRSMRGMELRRTLRIVQCGGGDESREIRRDAD